MKEAFVALGLATGRVKAMNSKPTGFWNKGRDSKPNTDTTALCPACIGLWKAWQNRTSWKVTSHNNLQESSRDCISCEVVCISCQLKHVRPFKSSSGFPIASAALDGTHGNVTIKQFMTTHNDTTAGEKNVPSRIDRINQRLKKTSQTPESRRKNWTIQ